MSFDAHLDCQQVRYFDSYIVVEWLLAVSGEGIELCQLEAVRSIKDSKRSAQSGILDYK